MSTHSDLTIYFLTEDEVSKASVLLTELNPQVPREIQEQRLRLILHDLPNYRCLAVRKGEQLIALCGIWIATKTWCGKYLEIDNFVVTASLRNQSVGELLLDRCLEIAREENCEIIVLDSYTTNRASHRFYHRHGFEIVGFHFVKNVVPD